MIIIYKHNNVNHEIIIMKTKEWNNNNEIIIIKQINEIIIMKTN